MSWSGTGAAAVSAIALSLSVMVAPIAADAAARPRTVPELPGFYQRVLTLPEAKLYAEPSFTSAVQKARVPTFSVLYVYDCEPGDCSLWLKVGAKADGTIDGWLDTAHAEDWRNMLVMQYAPRGQRNRVVMFKTHRALSALVTARDGAAKAKAIIDQIEAGHADPNVIAAVEPKAAVNPHNAFYLMPILFWDEADFADGTPTRLLQIAGVNRLPPRPQPAPAPPPPPAPKFRIGIVFVLETSNSMGPYIERTKEMIRETYQALEAAGTADRVEIGLVGYRANADRDRRLEYTTRVFQPLALDAAPDRILAHLDDIHNARARSPGWDEDAIAGLYSAMNDLDWQPYAARIIVIVADSGAIGGNSPLARYAGVDIGNIVEIADRKNIAVFPVYLMTPRGARLGNRVHALTQWHALGRTGDPTRDKFTGIQAGELGSFGAALDRFSQSLVETVATLTANHPIARPPVAPSPRNDGDGAAGIGQALVNELFRAQAEYLGTVAGTAAPTFFSAWVCDRDLVDPALPALQVRVFLTRNQLSELGASLARILDEAKRATLSPQTFFDNLQRLSAVMSGDPNRQGAADAFATIGGSNLLPAYLKALPYRSKVLRMTQSIWLDLGLTGQQEFIDELESKLRSYRDIEQDNTSWVDLGGGDRGSEVYPVALAELP
jgi:serine/threonine-protein kinase PpkA